MGSKLTGFKKLGMAAAVAIVMSTQGAWADMQSDVNAALGQPTPAAQAAAIRALAAANGNNPANFAALVTAVARGASEQNAGALTGALAAGCTDDCSTQTQVIVNTMVTNFPGAGGDILAACLANGCNQQIATQTFASAIATAAGQSLSLVPVLPPVTPGTGANLLGQGNAKEEGLTTRLGFTGENLPATVEPPASPTGITDIPQED